MDLNKTEGTTLENTMDAIQKLLSQKQTVLTQEIKKQTHEHLVKREQQATDIAAKHNNKTKIKKTFGTTLANAKNKKQ